MPDNLIDTDFTISRYKNTHTDTYVNLFTTQGKRFLEYADNLKSNGSGICYRIDQTF